MIILLMGVSGCGKTTIGKKLSEILNCPFHDGDDYHPPSNKLKMSQGQPLTDEDRLPWLNALADLLIKTSDNGKIILACSALKKTYRKILKIHNNILYVHLNVSFSVAEERLTNRKGHFFNVSLLKNQFETFEDLSSEEQLNYVIINCDKKSVDDVVKLALSSAGLEA